MHISTHVLTLKVYKFDPLLFQRHPIISAMRTILLGDNVRPFFLKIWVIHFLPKAPFPKIDLFMFYDMILITILTKPPQRKCTERYSEDINSCTISEMLQMHNNMVGRAIFIQHEKDKLNFTWENFSSSDFVGLTSNKDIGIIIYAIKWKFFPV